MRKLIIAATLLTGCVTHQADPDAICEAYCEALSEEGCPSHLSRNCETNCRQHREFHRETYPDCYDLLERVFECMSEVSCHDIEDCWPARQTHMDCYIPMERERS